MKQLWLFDIDGTLININHLHVKAHQLAYKEVLGINVPEELIISQFGNPARKERKIIFRKMGITEFNKINLVIKVFQDKLEKLLVNSSVKPLPGVIQLLSTLQKDNSVILGIVSGNPKYLGEKILKASHLSNYFKVLSFDIGKTRTDIVQKAINQYPSHKAIVIGDTIKDIIAAHNAGALIIAVSSGSCNLKQLSQYQPEILVSSLKDYNKIILTTKKLLK